jgi:hypothetical protein
MQAAGDWLQSFVEGNAELRLRWDPQLGAIRPVS